MSIINAKQWLKAANEDPTGKRCGFCGKTNDLVDEYGWFYVESYFVIPPDMFIPAEQLPCCEGCWNGEPGNLHREIYGVGER